MGNSSSSSLKGDVLRYGYLEADKDNSIDLYCERLEDELGKDFAPKALRHD